MMTSIKIALLAMLTPFFISVLFMALMALIRRRFVLIDAAMDLFIGGTLISMIALALDTFFKWSILGFAFFVLAVGVPAMILLLMKCDRVIDSVMGYDDPRQYTDGSILEDKDVIYG